MIIMKKNSSSYSVLLVMCVRVAVAQFIGPQSQQGQILSDVQQHHHRFNVPQQQQQFAQFVQQQQPTNFPQQFQQQQPLNVLTNQAQTVQQQFVNNRNVLQHHTQTAFTPNFNQAQPATALPTVADAIFNGGQSLAQFQQHHAQTGQLDPEKQKQRLKELKEKQAIIDKHNQFVEKQYEKALKKAQSEHAQFLEQQKDHKKKLYQNIYKNESPFDTLRFAQTNPRYIYPEETDLFKLAVKKYYEEHPTTTTTTTTIPPPTTTQKVFKGKGKSLDDSELYSSKIFGQLKTDDSEKSFLPTAVPKIQTLDDLSILQKQYKNQQIKKDDLLAQLRLAIGDSSNLDNKNVSSREIALPNGQRLQIIRTSDPKSIPGAKPLDLDNPDFASLLSQTTTTTSRPPKAILEELTKGVIPPGANFELLKHGSSGLEQVGGQIPNQKKVTFILLEEQNDGSFKVQGVKGNAKEKSEVDVDSILKKIKDGEIKLPPNTKLESVGSTISPTQNSITDSTDSITVVPNSSSGLYSSTPILKTNIGTHFVASSTASTYYNSHSTTPRSIEGPSPVPKKADFDSLRVSSTGDVVRQNPSSTANSIFTLSPKPTNPTYTPSSSTYFTSVGTTLPSVDYDESLPELPEVLKRQGLYAMARFLRQSGLDTILNETGPYTIFAPTDKAFRTLLVQLGGPEKAEEKFKENPRLLSGLLLHHVIPGAFKIETLQDEMTGVSLAGTQLRVNQYNMHDLEWNDIKITTINGAKVMDDKKDIEIPQGIAHAVDRVMFPLPVGDIVQTLQSDRERRFTNFLRALFASGLVESLQGTKTFTLFAPTDKAFAGLTSEELTRTVTDRVLARDLVMRHLASGTLYTNGMRYYQIRDSLESSRQITISKSSGRVKVNNNPIITQNIPATNGVIHALDTLL